MTHDARNLKNMIAAVCAFYGENPQTLFIGKSSLRVKTRVVVCYLALKYTKYSNIDLGIFFATCPENIRYYLKKAENHEANRTVEWFEIQSIETCWQETSALSQGFSRKTFANLRKCCTKEKRRIAQLMQGVRYDEGTTHDRLRRFNIRYD